MRFIIFLFVFVTEVFSAFAQDSSNTSELLATHVLAVSLDPLQQIYFINENRQVVKLSSIQDKSYIYSDIMIDASTSINTQNPFKVVLYKKDVGDVIILDNRLTLTAKTNLFNLGYFTVPCLTSSTDNRGIWLFDSDRQQIIKLDQQYNPVFQSVNLSQWVQKRIHPTQILEVENKLYLLDPEFGIYIFDNLGTYIQSIPIENIEKIWVFSGQIYFYRDQQIWRYQALLFEEVPLYKMDGYKSISLCKDFVVGINGQNELYKMKWQR